MILFFNVPAKALDNMAEDPISLYDKYLKISPNPDSFFSNKGSLCHSHFRQDRGFCQIM